MLFLKFKNAFLILSFLLFSLHLSAQQKFTISGTIKDKSTGEALIGATIRVTNLPNTGVSANEYGFFSLTLPAGEHTLKGSFIGYQDFVQKITFDKNIRMNIELSSGTELAEVIIKTKKDDDNISKSQMGVDKIEMKDVKTIPMLFGERDVLKTIQLLPGVKSAGEGNSGFYVRGGAADQNLILLDEAPVYNASHLLGFFSTFNADAIKDATLYKGNSPAQYGGRLASTLDIKMNEGNDKDYHVSGGIGIISSRLNVEGPIKKENGSFLLTARRTYADVFLKATPDFKDNSLYFYDVNMKANYKLGEKDHVYLSGYFGRDKLGFGDQFGIDWGNKTGTLRWNHVLNQKLFSNTSLIYSDYDYNIKVSGGGNTFNINSRIKDYNFKQEFQFFPNTNNSWRLGFNTIHHTITPSRFQGDDENVTDQNKDTRYGLESAVWVNNTFVASPKLNIDYGLRVSSYSVLGGGTYRTFDNKGIETSSILLDKNEFGKTYYNLEPRLTASYRLNEVSSIKGGYSRNTQHLHLLSNSVSTNPTDQWIGNSYNIKPEISDQIGVGYFRNFANNKYEFSVETYYKSMQNQVDYKNGADLQTSADIESQLLYGVGRAYGAEFFLKKRTGKLTGWVSYTLSRTERKIEGINNNDWYAAKQDRTHDISIVGMYPLSSRWTLSANFVFYTGNAITFPSGKYNVDGNTVYLYTERNGYRMPDYHRLDLGLTYEKKRSKKYQSSWNFSLYNAYGRENAYTISFRDNEADPSRTEAVQTSLFKWVPSVTYNFKF